VKKGFIGDIGRYAVHDGPGIRTTVFFKGCALHCPWCHNPEFISPKAEIAFYPQRCIGCGDCLSVCPEGALTNVKPVRLNRSLCTGCGLCAEECPAKALELVGRSYDLEELVEILLRDRLFYETSGGGVTLSGGEPTGQLDFIASLLRRLQGEGIHTAIETNGFFPWDEFEAKCFDHLDLILFDVKIADPDQHRRIIGVNNDLILANLARLLTVRPEDVIVRIPLIPGYTATEENIRRLAALFRDLGVRRCSLLPYHPYGLSKAAKIGRKQAGSLPEKAMARSELLQWQSFFTDMEMIDP
jgi:pyruvate formate lyase activating enzyme